ncbi:hypothetical protein TNCV_4525171 [Trichonephila clavipes]|nr:hypothetical protein TNCV_4525171 [Trichonephila clavipes]
MLASSFTPTPLGHKNNLEEQLSGGSVVVVHEPHPVTGTLSYRPEETGAVDSEKIARHTTQVTGRPISRLTVARKLHGWWSVCMTPYESRFSLIFLIAYSSGAGKPIIPRTSLKGTGMEVAVFSFGEASCLVVVQTFTSSTQVQSTGPVIAFLLPYERRYGSAVPFHGRQCTMSSLAAKQLLVIEHGLAGMIFGSQSHRACQWTYLTVTIRASIDAARLMGAMPQQLIAPSFKDAVKPA